MKSLPKVLLSLVLFLSLVALTANPVFAQTDPGDATICSTVDPNLMDPAACAALVDLFSQQNNPTDGPWYNQNLRQFATKVLNPSNQDEIFGERYTYAQINWIINSIATMLNPAANISSATDLIRLIEAIKNLVQADAGHSPSIADYSRLGPVGLFMGTANTLYANPPASGVQQIKDTAQKIFDLGTGATPAYAQGYGFRGLNSGGAVSALWTASRNMAYLIMVILLIASGFLIMFRIKINPQTVVSLQTMIPKLIITMLLVTFSFAIAGLIIDLIYVLIAMFVGMMVMGGIIEPARVGLFGATSTGEIIKWLTDPSFLRYYVLQMFPIIFLPFVGLVIGFFVGLPTGPGAVVGALIGAVIGIILSVWLYILLIRIFIMLVKAYIFIVLQTIIAPLQIMLDLIPGQHGFGPWIRNMIAQASVFVTVPIMLVIQNVIAWNPITNNILHLRAFGPGGFGGTDFLLPYVNLTGNIGGGPLDSFNLLTRIVIGYVILSLTPKIADIIRDALKIPPFKYGSAIGEPMRLYTKAAGGALIGYGKETKGATGGVISAAGEAVSGFIR